MLSHLSIHNLSFRFPGSSYYLIKEANLHFRNNWTGIVGRNGSGKTTLAKLITGELKPDQGEIIGNVGAEYFPQEPILKSESLEEFLYDDSNESGFWKSMLGIEYDFLNRIDHLSYGERKRVLLAIAVFSNPGILILDEPTNHLDEESKDLFLTAMSEYKGIGILISHDRELLDLCESCVFVNPPIAMQRAGNYTEACIEKEKEEEEVSRNLEQIRKAKKKLDQELKRRNEEALTADRKKSKKGLSLHDHDGRARINLARFTGKDGHAGKLKSQLESRIGQMEKKESSLRSELSKKDTLGASWKTGFSKRDFLFQKEESELDFGYLKLKLGKLSLFPESKISLNGSNGSGKSSFLKWFALELNLTNDKVFYLPQEFTKEDKNNLKIFFEEMDSEKKGEVLSTIHRFGSDPTRILESNDFSPGEWKKLSFAVALGNRPELLILDEPTNHLDLASIEVLESILQSAPSAILLVSHDIRFLERLSFSEWKIQNGKLSADANTTFYKSFLA
ncbi:ATP-binding cassette domain-containing protein [Leptospira ilyithenensis]|uniref:ABC transporter ATP-binding protein n=1 Tax=Leptospira ilyithenensis TaxID=2484901 RepID=A0A4R9LQS4_9LEPT|nr:ATP-binding cassette domain-containing protein [Leptospira ilyithenensis]TGN11934.1 ABC transporter ATP-binding protein [Leptospira ilyithenensis]